MDDYFDITQYNIDPKDLFGSSDKYLSMLEKSLHVTLLLRDGNIRFSGETENSRKAKLAVEEMCEVLNKNGALDEQSVNYILNTLDKGDFINPASMLITGYTFRGKPIRAKTKGQNDYLKLIKNNDIVFAIGPAGTGKTYLAVAMAVNAYKNNEIDRIILTRPAVEAGESLGFLPGDLKEKVDPYLRPLYDALYDIMGYETYERLLAKGIIEIAPLAYMRGRTLDNAFIILDEAQNTTFEQMKMFLTRLGYNSRAVVTGDITQIDLPGGKKSALPLCEQILSGVSGIAFSYLRSEDVVRNPIVQRIIKAYEIYEKK